MTTPYPLAVPPLPTLSPRSWSWSRSQSRCLPWLRSWLCHYCLPHPPPLFSSLSISHQFLLDTSRSNWTNIWVRPLLSNFFKILPLALPWSTSPTLCLTKHQIQIFITLKKGPMQFFLHLSEPVIFVQNKYRITNHQTWKYSLLHCLCTAQLISKMKGCFVIFNSSFTEQNYEHLFLDMAKGIMKANELYAQNSYQLWLITCQGEQIIITWLLAGLHNPQLAPRCIQLNILTIWTLVWYDRVGKNVASKRNVVLGTT